MPKTPKAGSLFGKPSPEPEIEALPASRQPTSDVPQHRIGRKAFSTWLPEPAIRQIKALAAEEGKSVQSLMAEIINREFARKGKAELA
jgi:hypothetical protein